MVIEQGVLSSYILLPCDEYTETSAPSGLDIIDIVLFLELNIVAHPIKKQSIKTNAKVLFRIDCLLYIYL